VNSLSDLTAVMTNMRKVKMISTMRIGGVRRVAAAIVVGLH